MKNTMVFFHILILTFIFVVSTGFINNVEIADSQAKADGVTPVVQEEFFNVYINDQNVGVVRFASQGLSLYDQAILDKKASYNREVFVISVIHFKKASADVDAATPDNLLLEAMKSAFQIETEAYSITIGDETIAFLPTEEEARQVLELVEKPYRVLVESKADTWLEEIKILEEPVISTGIIPYDKMVNIDTALKLITVGVEKAQNYEVKKGDTLWDIANEFGVTISDIMLANPELKDDKIHPGDLLHIVDVRNMTTVFTRERHIYRERIDYETENRKTDSLYVGQSRTIRQGERGENEVTIYITRENGEETDRGIVSDTVIKEPVSRIVEQGTKQRPRPVRTATASRGNDRPSDLNPIPRDGVVMMPWFDGVEDIFHRGMVVKVTHVNTGLTFYARRFGGRFHADSEPLTVEDTEVLRRIYGGGFSWRREAILVEIGGRRIAASMNGMPHGGEFIQDNNFQGHFCIHFYGSFLHETGRRDAEHQAMVRYAAGR